jgi:hypothetical protein
MHKGLVSSIRGRVCIQVIHKKQEGINSEGNIMYNVQPLRKDQSSGLRFSISKSSTSKIKVANGGMVGRRPREPKLGVSTMDIKEGLGVPYALLWGMVRRRFSPMHILRVLK